ncbi:MAG: hypothetical protein ACRDKA_10070 [Actinomycetota bacterium]
MDERSRHQLHQRLEEVLGAEEAVTLMAHLPPGGTSRLATKDDLEAVKHELLAEIHRTARNLTLSLTTIMAVMIGIVFTAVRLG